MIDRTGRSSPAEEYPEIPGQEKERNTMTSNRAAVEEAGRAGPSGSLCRRDTVSPTSPAHGLYIDASGMGRTAAVMLCEGPDPDHAEPVSALGTLNPRAVAVRASARRVALDKGWSVEPSGWEFTGTGHWAAVVPTTEQQKVSVR